MPIRPIDMQVAIPKLSEVSRMSHLDQQKAGLQQDQGAVTNERNKQQENRTVSQMQADSRTGTEADAREKGKNTYMNTRQGNKKQQKDQKKKGPDSDHRIDIRI